MYHRYGYFFLCCNCIYCISSYLVSATSHDQGTQLMLSLMYMCYILNYPPWLSLYPPLIRKYSCSVFYVLFPNGFMFNATYLPLKYFVFVFIMIFCNWLSFLFFDMYCLYDRWLNRAYININMNCKNSHRYKDNALLPKPAFV